MDDDANQPQPLPVLSADQYEQVQSMDWIAPEDDSRVRTFLFKFLPLFFLCLVAYWSAWRGSFVWLDDVNVTTNALLRSPAGLGLIWKAPTSTPEWSPVGYSILWPQHFIWSGNTPTGYHLISLLIHTCNAMLVWMLLKRLECPWPFVTAMIFALHPLQIESAAWIARQPHLVGCFFGLWFLIIYLRWSGVDPTVPNPSRIFRLPEGPKKLYTLALIALFLAVGSAPLMVCMLPIVMLLILWWKKKVFVGKDIRAMSPFIAMGVCGAIFSAMVERRHSSAQWAQSPVESVLLAARGVVFYVQKFFWPSNLTVIHRNWTITPRDVLTWVVIAGVLTAIGFFWVRRREIGRLPFAGAVILLLLLLPTLTPLNLASIHLAYVADRFAYLAVAVMAALVVGAVATIGGPIVRDERWPAPVAIAVLIFVLTWAVFFGHTSSFATATALWENTASNDDANVAALINLAKEYEKEPATLPQALELYQRVLRLSNGRNIDAMLNLGKIYEQNDVAEALRYYNAAIAAAPNRPEPYRLIGPVLVRQGKFDDAIALYKSGLTLFPKDDALYRQLGRVYALQGKNALAVEVYKKSIEINAYDSNTHVELGTVYFSMKDVTKAVAEIEIARNLDPRNYQMYMSVGEMFVRSQQWDRAYDCYRNASFLKPDEAEPRNNVGLVATVQARTAWQVGQTQLAQDKLKEARVSLKRALELKPDYAAAKKNLNIVELFERQFLTSRPRLPGTRRATSAPTDAH